MRTFKIFSKNKIDEKMMSEMIEELKEIQMENKRITEESRRIKLEREETLKNENSKDQKNKDLKKEIAEIKKEFAVLKEKHEYLVEEMKTKKNSATYPKVSHSMKKGPLIILSSLGVECILNYMDPNKRLLTSLHNEEFLEMEKRFPLRLDRLELSNTRIVVNDTNYEFRDEQGKWSCSDPQCSIYKASGRIQVNIMETTQDLFFHLFTGRRNFRVEQFQTTTYDIHELPEEKIDVQCIVIDGHVHKRAMHYRHYVRSVDRLVILNLYHIDSLRSEWIKTVKRLEMLERDQTQLIEALPDLRAEEIYVSLHDIFQCIDVIREWCQNGSSKIGWKLFLVFDEENEYATINEVLNSNELREIGFVTVSKEIRRKSLANNLEVMLTVREDKGHFSEEFLDNKEFHRYLSLEIVNS